MASWGLLCNFDVARCLPHQIRRLIGDFGVPIAIFIMITIDISIEDAYTQVGIAWEGVTSSQKKNENNPHAIFFKREECVSHGSLSLFRNWLSQKEFR